MQPSGKAYVSLSRLQGGTCISNTLQRMSGMATPWAPLNKCPSPLEIGIFFQPGHPCHFEKFNLPLNPEPQRVEKHSDFLTFDLQPTLAARVVKVQPIPNIVGTSSGLHLQSVWVACQRPFFLSLSHAIQPSLLNLFHCKKNLLNCLKLTCSMLQPSCHLNCTSCLNYSWKKFGITAEASWDLLHVNYRQYIKFFLNFSAFIKSNQTQLETSELKTVRILLWHLNVFIEICLSSQKLIILVSQDCLSHFNNPFIQNYLSLFIETSPRLLYPHSILLCVQLELKSVKFCQKPSVLTVLPPWNSKVSNYVKNHQFLLYCLLVLLRFIRGKPPSNLHS
ncbi:hypothetical protein VP01_1590g2 [Puccinia sorghi]|uniref:Uncharacterized protein n=1 Tax=Puccinia sorghi TaxID=27349 RepID=A0A0L6VJA8_9BASI|nr:hypothetical protein VP01_1590g2 [Puccinia sorghi]